MCSIKEGFILCACDEEKLKQPEIDWILRRINPSKPILHKKGKIARPQTNPELELSKEMIELALNQRSCFDFDFVPQQNDLLTIKLTQPEEIWTKFQFDGKQWKIDKSSPFAGWKAQLETYKSGKIQ